LSAFQQVSISAFSFADVLTSDSRRLERAEMLTGG
jgi:hypothetical protein